MNWGKQIKELFVNLNIESFLILVGGILVLLLVIRFVKGLFFKVKEGKMRAIFRNEKFIKTVSMPGYHFRPLFSLVTDPFPARMLVLEIQGSHESEIKASTKDGLTLKAKAKIFYKLSDLKLYLANFEIPMEDDDDYDIPEDPKDLLKSSFLSSFRKYLNRTNFGEVMEAALDEAPILKEMNEKVFDYGLTVEKVLIEELVPPPEFETSARNILEFRSRTEYLAKISQIVGKDPDKLIELLAVFGQGTDAADGLKRTLHEKFEGAPISFCIVSPEAPTMTTSKSSKRKPHPNIFNLRFSRSSRSRRSAIVSTVDGFMVYLP